MFVSTKETEMQIESNILTNCFIMNDIKLKEQTHGWINLDRYQIDLIQQRQAG